MAVKNNSGEEVILDCDYSLRPDDDDLAVKWYLNEEVVYQWIPPRKPQSLGRLKDKIDLSFMATNDPKSVYRAMKITNPTSEIAGEYKCFVSTFTDEDFSSKQMIVFEPEKTLSIEQKSDGNSINFTCFATEVYPIPKLILFKDKKDDFHNRNPLKIMQWDTIRTSSGRFSVHITATAAFKSIAPGSLIHCELRISGTAYVKRKTLLYYPEALRNGSYGTGNITHQLLILLIYFIFFKMFVTS
ncbi:hypothetical protein WA026_018616 [Henosepilachna vigintioctopunctata]|uniref:Ig-like domain-containing protein n=1 Tax=Henosepilachna vigintioctopunctata TaxID=420089 RepID=A0AAW1U9W8_9CUCU